MAENITKRNAQTLLFASFWTIGLITFLNFMNPYVFEILGIPEDKQGSLAGLLVALQEATQLAICGFIGSWSDRIGRRPIYVGGLLLLAAGFAVYPLAMNEYQLIALRVFYAVGATTCTVMLSTCLGEYIDDRTRGRWMGVVAIANGLGIVTMAIGVSKLPLLFGQLGLDSVTALRSSFWVCATVILLLAVLLQLGLQPPTATPTRAHASLLKQTLNGLALARNKPMLAMRYLTAFASKGDLVIVTTFISLWVVQAGLAAGMSPGAAVARAGMVFGITSGVALTWSIFMGMILDRIPRLIAVGIAFALASIGYICIALVTDPLGSMIFVAAVLVGIGESSVIISAGTLIGQSAPAGDRGAAFGVYGFAGSAGILVLSFAGGKLYDAFGGGAPFLMMGVINGLIVVAALLLFYWQRIAGSTPCQERLEEN